MAAQVVGGEFEAVPDGEVHAGLGGPLARLPVAGEEVVVRGEQVSAGRMGDRTPAGFAFHQAAQVRPVVPQGIDRHGRPAEFGDPARRRVDGQRVERRP